MREELIEKGYVRVRNTDGLDSVPEIDLNLLQKHMKRIKFYGQTTILWQEGEIVVIREERTVKPANFDILLIS